MTADHRVSVVFEAPERVALHEEALPEPSDGEVRVQTVVSGISPGTERLIYRGDAPKTLAADASFASMEGAGLEFPLRYGYACVGVVDATGPSVASEWEGTRVFAFQPHTSAFTADPDTLIPLPEAVTDEEAVLIPSLETAVNVVMDGQPVIGEKVVVFGQGVVGLLTTFLLSRHPLGRLVAVEPSGERRRWANRMGADRTFSPDDLPAVRELLGINSPNPVEAQADLEGADLVYELSGQPQVLNDAVASTGFAGRILVGSWYGQHSAPLNLGGRFHRSQMELKATQVSTVDPQLRGRWTKERRMQLVLSLLAEDSFEPLITHAFSIRDVASAYESLDAASPSMLQPLLRYDSLD